MMRDHRLVGGDERLAAGDRLARQGQGRTVRAADHLDHHIDLGPGRQFGGIVEPQVRRKIHAPVLAAIARADSGNANRTPGPPGNQRGIGLDQAHHAGSNGAEPGKGDVQRFSHDAPFRVRALSEPQRDGQWLPVAPHYIVRRHGPSEATTMR
jgi:hypothetical protein